MKTILVYGDSNTYGQTSWPYLGEPRLPYDQRWTSHVQHHFEGQIRLIAEGLGGRTAGNLQGDKDAYRNGQEHFQTIFCSHQPVDILVIALGTNDCQLRYARTAQQIYQDLLWYQKVIGKYGALDFATPRVVYITPPIFRVSDGDMYYGGRNIVRDELVMHMAQSEDMNIIRLDDVELSDDGVHFSAAGHQQVALAVEEALEAMITGNYEEKI
jgi:lysophospholipase L1-like esterase